jgi:hypothetical protein
VSGNRALEQKREYELVPALVEDPECVTVTAAGAFEQLAVCDLAFVAAHIIHNDPADRFVTKSALRARCDPQPQIPVPNLAG